MTDARAILQQLGVAAENSGTWAGDGGWLAQSRGALIEVVNPASGARLATVRASDATGYERVMQSAHTAAQSWRAVPAPRRGDAIRHFAALLREFKEPLGLLVSLENGKIRAEGLGEVQEMIDIADLAVGQSRMLYGLTMHSERPQHRMYEQWHPLGVVGIISAFNFPVAVWAWNAFLAAVCGNVSVWKPSPKTPLTAIAVQKLAERVMLERDLPPIFQLFIDAGTELATRFVDDPRVALVSFTGSTRVGREVGMRVASRLGKSLLELGGNNAIIVDESADLSLVVPAIVFGAVGTAGQRCTSTRRVFVQRALLSEVERRLVKAYSQVRIGDPTDANTLMGPLIDARAVAAYSQAIERARAAGGVVLCGDQVLERVGHFVAPTIIRAQNDWEIVQTETFGPILYLIPFDTLDAAIEMHNAAAHGLSSALFTEKLRHAELFLSHAGSDCGIANINIGTSGAEIGGAFGGEKDTGGGRESGSDAWKAYMRRQTNTINYSSALPLAQGIKFDL
ncbi:MAG TPA: aldehyde dehydrogenase family protein [Steroidobacteraceae bacterium]|nr:aldehyde dehydrogenase family protein [Steroidobacteraceae bacterium]HRX89127.1 aldehyde dehydrogenase family protein [Steroidobacteraceae bacterium]